MMLRTRPRHVGVAAMGAALALIACTASIEDPIAGSRETAAPPVPHGTPAPTTFDDRFAEYGWPADPRVELPVILAEWDVTPLIEATTHRDVLELRGELIDAIWPATGFSFQGEPDAVSEDVASPLAEDADNLARVDRLVTVMEHGVDSRAYHFLASDFERCVFIYHHGHIEHFSAATPTIVRLLDEGCDVVALNMPLTAGNHQPAVDGPPGPVVLVTHDLLVLLETSEFSPLSYFLEPVTASLNHALATRDVEHIAMIGLSGGGWTTTVYAALDERVAFSAPVAGSLPLFLRTWKPHDSWGDYEQVHPIFLDIAGYMDLYIMAAADGRRQVQVLNQFDPCCFSGIKHQVYEEAVAGVARELGGDFSVYLDTENRDHSLSSSALDHILDAFWISRPSHENDPGDRGGG